MESKLICAECSCEFLNTAMQPRTLERGGGGFYLANIAEAVQAVKDGKKIQSASGYILGITADTMWKGTYVCRYHAVYLIQEMRGIEKGFRVE